MAILETDKSEVSLVLTTMGGRVVTALPMVKPDGDDIDFFLVNRNGRPHFYIVTDMFATSTFYFSVLEVVSGPDHCTAYRDPGPDGWQTPLQHAVLSGMTHIPTDIVRKVFRDISPTLKPPSNRPKQVRLILERYGESWGVSETERDEILKKAVKSIVGKQRKPKAPKDDAGTGFDDQTMAALVAECCESDREYSGGD